MLMTMKDQLAVANQNGFAVPAFNTSNYAMLKGIFQIAEELRSPVIIALHPNELGNVGVEYIAAVTAKAHNASVPVSIHLDHGGTFEQVMLAIRSGFTSVMIDGSHLPFEGNVALCQKVVEAAHAAGVTVEGELGTIGQVDIHAEEGADTIIYTNPDDAVAFVEQTGVDVLAVAIGTSHGIYPKGKKPKLRLDLLEEIKGKVSIPLVLHGGSDNPDEEIAAAVRLGVSKVNISSDIKAAYYNEMRKVLQNPDIREPKPIQAPCIEAMKAVAGAKIALFGAGGKADLY